MRFTARSGNSSQRASNLGSGSSGLGGGGGGSAAAGANGAATLASGSDFGLVKKGAAEGPVPGLLGRRIFLRLLAEEAGGAGEVRPGDLMSSPPTEGGCWR